MSSKFVGAALLSLLMTASAFAQSPAKIAFVDTGNTGRSVSAEAIAGVLIGQRGWKVAVISRAIDMNPFDVHPEAHAAALLRERGIDVSGHMATQLTGNDARHADLILTMTAAHKARVIELFPEARDRTRTLAEYATGTHADIPDAWGQPKEAYVLMIKQLDACLPAALEKAAPR